MWKKNRKWNAVTAAVIMAGLLTGCSQDSLEVSLQTFPGLSKVSDTFSLLFGRSNNSSRKPDEPEMVPENQIDDPEEEFFAEYEPAYEYEELSDAMVSEAFALSGSFKQGAMQMLGAPEPVDSGWIVYDTGNGCTYGSEEEWNTEEYRYTEENRWMSAASSPFSTFAADVDTASYANLRRMILQGKEIPADAVRIEEMLNYFHYDYPEPEEGEPFSVTTKLAPCPWNDQTDLLLIGMQAGKVEEKDRPASNLVFLIDVSGSMDEPDKLPLVQRAFRMLAERMTQKDRISVVTYASQDQVVLDGVSGEKHAEITSAIEDLFAEGGTNGSAGIQTAYALAEKNYIEGGNNRVILATDGDLNLGITDEGSLTRLIQKKAKSGVFLSVLGFGWGNLSDSNMEALADHGNGNYSYIDSIQEARRVLIDEMGGTLQTVAKDVKLQVEFNPSVVKGYRLIGYENRTMAAEDFSDDTKDGGEIGAGHQMTALYEIARNGSGQDIPEVQSRYGTAAESRKPAAEVPEKEAASAAGVPETETAFASEALETEASSAAEEWLAVNIRYKEPEGEQSRLLVFPVGEECRAEEMDPGFLWACGVAEAGMLLKNSSYAGTGSLEEARRMLRSSSTQFDDSYRDEFIYLLGRLEK